MWRTKLRVEEDGYDLTGRAVWELLEPLCWKDEVVPPGFRTNYASVPRLPIVFLLAGDKAHKPAAWHDFEYTVRRRSREEADDLFLEMLLADPQIKPGLAHTMHKAVRWFGQSSWEDETNIVQPEDIRALINVPPAV